MNYADTLSINKNVGTPQNQPILGRETEMSINEGGGVTFNADSFMKLSRFLFLGTEGGSYTVSQKDLTKQNFDAIKACIKQDALKVLNLVKTVSDEGRAPKNDQAIFVLALILKLANNEIKKLAIESVPSICRIGTHIMLLTEYLNKIKGWGRVSRKAIASWYHSKDTESLAYQLVKYKSRGGGNAWSHLDLLRSGHVKPNSEDQQLLFNYVAKGFNDSHKKFPLLHQQEIVMKKDVTEAEILVAIQAGLPWEALPTEFLTNPTIWEALLTKGLPMTALIRNLGRLTSLGVLKPFGSFNDLVVKQLTNIDAIKKARIHPVNALIASKTYRQGKGEKGKLQWKAVPQISDALEKAFELSFNTIEPTNKNILIGVDVSGSMTSPIPGSNISSAEFAAVIAMIVAKTENNYHIMGFSSYLKDLGITANDNITSAMKKAYDNNFRSTNCSLPIQWAISNKAKIDAIVIITDNDANTGETHPSELMAKYRKQFNLETKMIVVSTYAGMHTILDPNDTYGLDISGFDSSVPKVIQEFITGF